MQTAIVVESLDAVIVELLPRVFVDLAPGFLVQRSIWLVAASLCVDVRVVVAVVRSPSVDVRTNKAVNVVIVIDSI